MVSLPYFMQPHQEILHNQHIICLEKPENIILFLRQFIQGIFRLNPLSIQDYVFLRLHHTIVEIPQMTGNSFINGYIQIRYRRKLKLRKFSKIFNTPFSVLETKIMNSFADSELKQMSDCTNQEHNGCFLWGKVTPENRLQIRILKNGNHLDCGRH